MVSEEQSQDSNPAPAGIHLLYCNSFASSTGQNGVPRDGNPKLGPFGVSFSCLLVSILDIYFCSV